MSGKRRNNVSRREFIHTGAVGTTALLGSRWLEGMPSDRVTVRGACMHDCPDTCAWLVTTEKGKAVELKGDPDHPMTRGTLCEKMDGFLTDVVYNPDRLLSPLKRVGAKGEGRFERVSWDKALDDVATRLRRIIDEHGGESILPFSFAGTIGMVQGWSLDARFFKRLGASELGRNICGSTAAAGLSVTLGTSTGILQEDIADSRFIVLWGGNPVVTNPHGWFFIEDARAAGAQVVVIDPLVSETALRADWHLRPRPGTDPALALAMMHVIVREGLHDADYLERHTVGFDRLRERLDDYSPARAAEITALPEQAIVQLAKAYATTRPAAIQVHIGMEKHQHGGMTYRSIACLPAVVGAWRERGGGLFYDTGALFNGMNFSAVTSTGDFTPPSTREINMSQLGRALTDADLDPPVQAMIVYNSNPATIAPNQNLVIEGLKRNDLLTVVLDHFVTDTALYADYVFPATTEAEHLDLIVPYGSRYLSLNQPAIAPRGESVPNTEFFRRLSRKLGFDDAFLQASDEELIELAFTSDDPSLEGVTYARLKRDGWASVRLPERRLPFAEGGFPTPSGKCELYSEAQAAAGRDPLPGYVAPDRGDTAKHPLHFMSPKWNRYFVNSSHANQPRLLEAAGEPRLRIHPEDASKRGIENGQSVRVFNDRGAIVLTAEVTDRMQPNIVVLLHGWWASRIGGSSANALTPDSLADLGGGGTLHDTWVEVEKA